MKKLTTDVRRLRLKKQTMRPLLSNQLIGIQGADGTIHNNSGPQADACLTKQ